MAKNTDNVIITRDYIDNFSMKENVMNNLVPKYFEGTPISNLNIGLTGFTMEQIANITEDSFNTISTLIKESFPNRAQIPESIYSNAAIFQLDNTFASASKCSFIIILSEDDIIRNAKYVNGIYNFYLDKNTVINVEDIPFTFDYDVHIKAKLHKGHYVYSAEYVLDSDNSISQINDPYLKIMKSNDVIVLQALLHQCQRTVVYENIISNTKINFPIIDVEYNGMLAGFDIFYKSPTDNDYTQLTKRINFTTPLKTPFCYYKQKDENKISISFTSKEAYFQPEFNSELKIVLYTTLGEDGNFDSYNGSDLTFEMDRSNYEYNGNIAIAAKVMSASQDGTNCLSLEGLRNLTVEGFTTANEISTENDIMTYFYNYKFRYGSEMYVIKRRDDITERLFSAFLLLKNNGEIYPTNTLNIVLKEDDYDISENDERFIIKPGHLFTYASGSKTDVVMIPEKFSYNDDNKDISNEFVFTNPFIISINKSPNIVGIYKNICNQTSILDFISNNDTSFIQFIAYQMKLYRNISYSNSYDLSFKAAPSSIIKDLQINLNSTDNDIRVITTFVYNETEVGYIELLPTEFDETTQQITFSTKIEVDDYITSNNTMRLLNVNKITGKNEHVYVPVEKVVTNVYTLYKEEGSVNRFTTYDETLDGYIITNTYSTYSEPLTFIQPMNMMRSTVTFAKEGDSLSSKVSLMPFVKHTFVNTDEFDNFITNLTNQYNYLYDSLPKLSNNTHIDVKLYNTYGKSNNYYIGDGDELIDKVNIGIKFNVFINPGVDEINLMRDIKMYIKSFIEKVEAYGVNQIFISNLITGVENTFSGVNHLKFLGINEYNTSYQTVRLKAVDISELSKTERRNYVPEILIVNEDDISLTIFSV